MSNGQSGDRVLRRGDIIRFDVGGRYRHYRAEIARIGVRGEPSEKVRRDHRALRAGLLRAYEVMRTGVRCSVTVSGSTATTRRT